MPCEGFLLTVAWWGCVLRERSSPWQCSLNIRKDKKKSFENIYPICRTSSITFLLFVFGSSGGLPRGGPESNQGGLQNMRWALLSFICTRLTYWARSGRGAFLSRMNRVEGSRLGWSRRMPRWCWSRGCVCSKVERELSGAAWIEIGGEVWEWIWLGRGSSAGPSSSFWLWCQLLTDCGHQKSGENILSLILRLLLLLAPGFSS